MLADTPAHYQQERIECSIQAANHYHIPALVMLAVAEQEGGKPGQTISNRNGTLDYGAMQINTVSLAELRQFGIQEKHVLANGCYPYFLAAWRIAGHLHNDSGDLWQRAANYHSRTPYFNKIYRNKLILRAKKLATHIPLFKSSQVQSDKIPAVKFRQTAVTIKQQDSVILANSAPIQVQSFNNFHHYLLQFKRTSWFDRTRIPKWY